MLYDPDTSLSRDEQSSCDVETLVADELAKLNVSKSNGKLAQKQRFIHFLQEKHLRLPHLVVRFGSQLIKNAASRLGHAVWDAYERVCVASLDAHDYTMSSWCITQLDTQFPNSTRVARLKGMQSEARGHYSTAEELYQEYISDDPSNISLYRREIACAKGANDLPRAILRLNTYVKNFSSDENAWVELGELYLQTQQYDYAAYVYEELILLAPDNYLYYLKYAELQYTLGEYAIARQYYAQSLELKPVNNLRALYGLILTLKTKAGSQNSDELCAWSTAQLLAHYKKYQSNLEHLAKGIISGEDSAAPSSSSNVVASVAPTATTPASASSPSTSTPSRTAAAAPVAAPAEPRSEPQPTDLPD